MLLKWIVCDVRADQRAAFSLAQEHWRAIAPLHGFCGQIGGWSTDQPHRACIASLWRDAAALQSFTQRGHDPIVSRSRQSETYASIRVAVLPINEVSRKAIISTMRLDIGERSIDFVRDEHRLLRLNIDSASLDADSVLIERAWTVEPSR